MTDCDGAPARPTERLIQAWNYQSRWPLEEVFLLALGLSPNDEKVAEALKEHETLLTRAKRSGDWSGAPSFWLWWAERNDMPFHTDWWLAVTPEGPIGYDGQHFAHHRREMLSEEYLQQEWRLIGNWARKPYWTAREAIDLSLNLEPFSLGNRQRQVDAFASAAAHSSRQIALSACTWSLGRNGPWSGLLEPKVRRGG